MKSLDNNEVTLRRDNRPTKTNKQTKKKTGVRVYTEKKITIYFLNIRIKQVDRT